MYDCPGCGGNLKFDIPTQQLACAFCNAFYDPYQITKDKDGEEQKDFEATIFTCPQCGGEIMSTDTTAAGFCSFCGASTILTSRLTREKRPDFIIPFQKTKEDCKKEYKKLMSRFIYCPSELKDPDKVNGFRGIYMPYWVYYFSQKGDISFSGKKSHRRGDYIYTKHYKLTGELNAFYKGLAYDGSSSFADRISESIAPFDVKNMKGFTPSILSGFYADTADVPETLYRGDAKKFANEETKDLVYKDKKFIGYEKDEPKDMDSIFHTQLESVDFAMFPVWFMSYKNGDRVSYATINGQTGKIFADLPVSIPKYLLGTLVLSIPVFLLLNMFLTLLPTTLVSVVAAIAMIVSIIYAVEIDKIAKKENDEDDKGKNEANRIAEQKRREKAAKQGMPDETKQKRKQLKNKAKEKSKKDDKFSTFKTILIILFLMAFSGPAVMGVLMIVASVSKVIVTLSSLAISLVAFFISRKAIKDKIDAKKGISAILYMIIAMAVTLLVCAFQPAHDYFYYAMAILILVSIAATLIDLIGCYNIFATRKIPQFDYHGGDDDAE